MHVACHCPNVSSNGSLCLHVVSNRLSRLQAHRRPSPSTCALQYPPNPANPRAPNCSPSLTSAVPSSTQVHHSCLSAPSSALSSPFNTPPALQHISNLYAILATCTLLYPLATVHRYLPPFRVTPCTHYHHPPAPCRLLPEFHESHPIRQRGVSEGCY
jgi:hypothetical protein